MKSISEAGWLALGIVTGVAMVDAAGLRSVLELRVDPVPFAQAAVLVLLASTVRPHRSWRRLRAGEPVVRSANGSWGRPPFSRPRRAPFASMLPAARAFPETAETGARNARRPARARWRLQRGDRRRAAS